MNEVFDPYYKWLGIPPAEQPPHHYRLLGLSLFERDVEVIEAAADQRMAHLQTFKTGRHSEYSQKLLNEVSSAKLCLLNPQKKQEYDSQLRQKLQPVSVASPLPQSPAFPVGSPSDSVPLINTGNPGSRPKSMNWQIPAIISGTGTLALLLALFLFSGVGGDSKTEKRHDPPDQEVAAKATKKQEPRNTTIKSDPPDTTPLPSRPLDPVSPNPQTTPQKTEKVAKVAELKHTLIFNGQNSRLTFPHVPIDECSAFTIEFWTRHWSGAVLMQGVQGDPENAIELFLRVPNTYFFWESGRGTNNWWKPSRSEQNRWEHWAIVYETGSITLFRDGRIVQKSAARKPGPFRNDRPLWIGYAHRNGPKAWGKGELGLLRISEIARYRTDFSPAKKWRADDETLLLMDGSIQGLQVLDLSNRANHGTFENVQQTQISESTVDVQAVHSKQLDPDVPEVAKQDPPSVEVSEDWTNLVKFIHPSRDNVSPPMWKRENNTLVSDPTGFGIVQLPWRPVQPYQLLLDVTRESHGGPLIVCLVDPYHGSQFIVYFDAPREASVVNGVEWLDGKPAISTGLTWSDQTFPLGVRRQLRIAVLPNQLQVSLGDRVLFDRPLDFSKFHLSKDFQEKVEPGRLAIRGSMAKFRLHRVALSNCKPNLNVPPTREALDNALKTVKDLLQADYDAAQVPADKVKVIDKVWKLALETQDDPAHEYVMLTTVRDWATEAEDGKRAFAAIDRLAMQFEINVFEQKAEVLEQFLASANREQAIPIGNMAAALSQQAINLEDYESADKLLVLQV